MQNPNQLTQACDVYDLKQIVKGPTCFKSTNNPSLIDVILTNCSKSLSAPINLPLGISDFHNYIRAATKIKCPTSEPKLISYRSLRNFKEETYKQDSNVVDNNAPMKKRL